MGLNSGMTVVEVVVKWNDGGIGKEVIVRGRRRLSCTFYAFWIVASSLEKVVEVVDWSFKEASLPWKSSRGEAQWVSLEGLRTRVLEELKVMPQFVRPFCWRVLGGRRCLGNYFGVIRVEDDWIFEIPLLGWVEVGLCRQSDQGCNYPPNHFLDLDEERERVHRIILREFEDGAFSHQPLSYVPSLR
ncbi:hypothetical protein Tco_1155091 [Tanacetum coccineum]